MDYEKKYRNALSWMRSVYPTLNGMAKEDAEHFFPELTESDDKRIWEAIVREFERASNSYLIETYDLSKDKFLAYLEKQKESLHVSDTYKENADSFTNDDEGTMKAIINYFECQKRDEPTRAALLDKWIAHLEKQKGSNDMAFHEGYTLGFEDGMKEKEPHYTKRNALFDKCVENCDPEVMKEVSDKVDEWDKLQAEFRSINEAFEDGKKEVVAHPKKYGLCKPAEWSEEDDQLIGFIFDLLNSLVWRKEWAMDKKECLERLKSLRPQPKQEWSEEDEKYLSQAIETLEHENYPILANKLRYLSPSWKPSEEQMDALESAQLMYAHGLEREDIAVVLESLYEQLKKLM